MALRYALMAALHEAPATGYELTQRFRSRLANVWNASHQQVYRELARLLEDNKLLVETVAQSDKPDKKRYHLTIAGRKDLEEWLNTPQPRPPVRDPLLVKLFAGDLLDSDVLKEDIEKLKQDWLAQLGYFRSIEHTYFRQPSALSRQYRLQYMALRRGITQITAGLEWLEELETTLEELDDAP
ncbi:PadR family transcriptional regulator [Marinobacter halodurans]|uniref:PadR family transcriptional regulator n=1 Tax=Marinobacter halodurans TaxID=2528979 RepID=A0ABY1ZJ75_9GAMM|nr:PadR family transcriptional regulator [Marinobacter halodurans]TBW49538.1 PadR family transcriptional regulator [Marinobacter halodurans]